MKKKRVLNTRLAMHFVKVGKTKTVEYKIKIQNCLQNTF